MIKTATASLFILTFIMASLSASSETTSDSIPTIQFENSQKIPVTQLCLDNKYVRPRPHISRGISLNPRPIREVIEYDLGHQRVFTLIRKVKIKNHLIRRYARRDGVQQLISQKYYDIPKCESSRITRKPETVVQTNPSPQQMLVLSALFQKGITLAQTDHYPFGFTPAPSSPPRVTTTYEEWKSSLSTATLKTPQCHNGKVELSPEFMRYLKGAEGQRLYRDVVDFLDMRPGYAEKYFNQIWNNHLSGQDLKFRGGEGSGNGRIGFGLSFIGGEGSGNGRRLEQTSTDPLSVDPRGEIQVKIYLNPIEYYSLDYTQGLIGRLFGQEIKYKQYLMEGEIIPDNIVRVECK